MKSDKGQILLLAAIRFKCVNDVLFFACLFVRLKLHSSKRLLQAFHDFH